MATSLNAKEFLMRRFSRKTIQFIVDCAIKEFLNDPLAPDIVCINYKGHYVYATVEWSNLRSTFYVSQFEVVYSNCVMTYKVGEDYDSSLAWCL